MDTIISNTNTSTVSPSTPAGIWGRGWAHMIDSIYINLTLILVYFLVGNLLLRFYFYIYLGTYILYSSFLLSRNGYTYGKDAYGYEVVTFNTNNRISFLQALIRETVEIGLASIPTYGYIAIMINILVIIFSPYKRGIHDLVANTQVIKTKSPWKLKKQLLFILLPFLIFVLLSVLYLPRSFK